jgi:hypothetical protein
MNNSRSIKWMLLGITMILIALYIQGEPGIRFYGNEVFIAFIGFLVSIFSFFVKDVNPQNNKKSEAKESE